MKKIILIALAILIVAILFTPLVGCEEGKDKAVFNVQTEYATIQSAIDAAFSAGRGDVWVSEGYYRENIVMKEGVSIYSVSGPKKPLLMVGGMAQLLLRKK